MKEEDKLACFLAKLGMWSSLCDMLALCVSRALLSTILSTARDICGRSTGTANLLWDGEDHASLLCWRVCGLPVVIEGGWEGEWIRKAKEYTGGGG
ncbi:hypothetical protein R1flu_020147 [Riccia fluitans]|uniref:Uncharacterized protein n=1 Tax=Riccia fluitans TaxID=41844 RepID=A0ABD1ZKQ0_9MARC